MKGGLETMKRTPRVAIVGMILLGWAGVSAFAEATSEDRADLILRHGVFYPGGIQGSLAVRGGRIAYQVLRLHDLERMARLGILASMQPTGRVAYERPAAKGSR
jgi:hypothetical protein